MKKGFKTYALIWAVLLVIFNAICFATPNELAGYTKLDATFWTSYIFMTLAFIGQLACAYKAFTADNAQKLFYNLPLITVSYGGLILMLVIGAACIAVPGLPNWIAAIAGVLILGFTAIAVIKASAAADIVEKVDEKIKTKTSYIRDMTGKAEGLMSSAKTPEVKAACKSVYEALRYSDPMSNDELSVIEAKITVKMDELEAALKDNSVEVAQTASEELVLLVNERARKCKALK